MSNDAIKAKMDSVYGSLAPSLTTIKYWRSEFRQGRKSVFDEGRPGRLKEVTTDEMLEKVHDNVLDNRKINLR